MEAALDASISRHNSTDISKGSQVYRLNSDGQVLKCTDLMGFFRVQHTKYMIGLFTT